MDQTGSAQIIEKSIPVLMAECYPMPHTEVGIDQVCDQAGCLER